MLRFQVQVNEIHPATVPRKTVPLPSGKIIDATFANDSMQGQKWSGEFSTPLHEIFMSRTEMWR